MALVNEGVWGAETHTGSGIVICADVAGALRAMERAQVRVLRQLAADPSLSEPWDEDMDEEEPLEPRILERGVYTGSIDRDISARGAAVFTELLAQELAAEGITAARLVPVDRWDWASLTHGAWLPLADAIVLDVQVDIARLIVELADVVPANTVVSLHDYRARSTAFAAFAAAHSLGSDWETNTRPWSPRLRFRMEAETMREFAAVVAAASDPFILTAVFDVGHQVIVSVVERGRLGVRAWRGLPEPTIEAIRGAAAAAG